MGRRRNEPATEVAMSGGGGSDGRFECDGGNTVGHRQKYRGDSKTRTRKEKGWEGGGGDLVANFDRGVNTYCKRKQEMYEATPNTREENYLYGKKTFLNVSKGEVGCKTSNYKVDGGKKTEEGVV